MIKKNYIAKGLTSVSLSMNIGGTVKTIMFNKGHRVGNAIRFATYSTTDEQIQKAIESLKYPIISLESTENIEDTNQSESDYIESITTNNEVKTMKDAISFMTSTFGMKAVQCNTKSKLQKKMSELHVEFPNIVYDI